MIIRNQAPQYTEVTSADGAGKQIVPPGCSGKVWAQIEGGGAQVASFRENSASGLLIGAVFGNLISRANTPLVPGHLIEFHDGLYIVRTGFSKLRLWVITNDEVA